jgi:hypothetical protein
MAAYLTIFDILLRVDRTVDQYLYRLAAIRTANLNGCELTRIYGIDPS